ncbi:MULTISPECIES: dihydrodipicolinate synthase family protein [unclassified Caballeronia]|uniref:dihydrodipicolinate synthase family protein n=1 Tax=unclassified Caballeronia TaxID=2646786 RepID=UPI002028DAE6|nr:MULTISPECIES: dihydrodipicolinate synthase family protein [unclassified Caballeronia]
MPTYTKEDAKAWARENMRGVANILQPSFSNDLKRLNEPAIRHDVRMCKKLGFWGALAVSECGTTPEEYIRFVEVAVDEAGPDFHIMFHASFDTTEETIRVGKACASAGADTMLLSYPPTWYPKSDEDLYEYTTKVLDEVGIATVLFAVHLWNFQRIHPAELSPKLVARLADHPLAVALKCEGGGNTNAPHIETLRTCGDKLLVSDPRDGNAPGHVQWFGMQWMGTSCFQFYGDNVPKYFKLMHEGKWDEAMEIFWRIHPARQARTAETATYMAGAHFIHRQSWKYMEWLNGFNGGRLRLPTMRLTDGTAKRLSDALIRSKIIEKVPGDMVDFYNGRYPM